MMRSNSRKTIKKNPFPDARAKEILAAIINEHLASGEPVGSKLMAEKFDGKAGLSAATVRNVMSELESHGLLEHPHTSAGRVPTDSGYRYYVDNLLGVLSLTENDLRTIDGELGLSELEIGESPDKLMERTSHLLSVLSNNIGIVVSPSLAHNQLQHIEFVNLSDNRVLVVFVSPPGIVHNKLIRLQESFTQNDLDRTARYLNLEFCGKSLVAIRAKILELMHEERALFDNLLQTAMILCSQSIESEGDSLGDLYVGGTSNMLGKSDFSGDIEHLRKLVKTIEEKSRFLEVLNECITFDDSMDDNVRVVIGSENSAETLRDCSLITAPYRTGNGAGVGSLSVLGPTRIEYPRMISVVSFLARTIEEILQPESDEPKRI